MRSLLSLSLAAGLVVALVGCDASGPDAPATDARKADPGFLILTVDAQGNASERRQDKVDLCHYDAETDTYERISVGAPAFEAHVERHPDGVPGGEVPGADVPSVFGEDCEVVPVERFTCEAEPGFSSLYNIKVTLTAIDPALVPLSPTVELIVTDDGVVRAVFSGGTTGDSATLDVGFFDSGLVGPIGVMRTTGADGTPLACGPYPLYPPEPV